ncbi:MAG: phosphoribosylformylglycinamidine cyclo-ligase [Ignavibacteria bacterium]
MKITYKAAGVNISKADRFIEKIKPLARLTFSENVLSGIGNFGAFFKIDIKKYKNPVLVSSIDGVGTKLLIASVIKKYDTVGEDLVNHCVNDIAVCGATPLFFMDYYAVGKLNVEFSYEILKGIVRGCKKNKLSLIGGETAEMPGLYRNSDFDLAGCIVGVVEQKNILSSRRVSRGDILIGIKSNGLHTNGYSLVRKIFSQQDYKKVYPGLNKPLGKELLRVHKSYLTLIQQSLKHFPIKAFAHITGGGIVGNTKRVVPSHLQVKVNWNSWKVPALFNLIQNQGNVPIEDMRRTFNLGIGLVAIVSRKIAGSYKQFLERHLYEKSYIIGEII